MPFHEFGCNCVTCAPVRRPTGQGQDRESTEITDAENAHDQHVREHAAYLSTLQSANSLLSSDFLDAILYTSSGAAGNRTATSSLSFSYDTFNATWNRETPEPRTIHQSFRDYDRHFQPTGQAMPIDRSTWKVCDSCGDSHQPGYFITDCEEAQGPLCIACCTCVPCYGHSTPTVHTADVAICESCATCTDNCECITCNGCGVSHRPSDLGSDSNRQECPECRRLIGCCGCRCPSPFEFWTPTEIPFHIGPSRKHHSKRFLAAEIEVAAIKKYSGEDKLMNVVKKWGAAIVSDGSVGPKGFEINTAPSCGDKFLAQVKEISESLAKHESTVTAQCGLHVHIDGRDYNHADLRRLIFAYGMTEHALFAAVPNYRVNGQYSQVCSHKYLDGLRLHSRPKDKKDYKKWERHGTYLSIYGSEPSQSHNRARLSRQKYNGSRYNALNLHSWMYRGTFENRMHEGTIKFEDIANWALINAAIIDFAYSSTEKILHGMWKDMNKAPNLKQSQKLLREMIPGDKQWEWYEGKVKSIKSGQYPHNSGTANALMNRPTNWRPADPDSIEDEDPGDDYAEAPEDDYFDDDQQHGF